MQRKLKKVSYYDDFVKYAIMFNMFKDYSRLIDDNSKLFCNKRTENA